MKQLPLILTLCSVITSASAQGFVSFANASTTSGLSPADRAVRWADSATNYSPLLQPGGLVSSNYSGLDLSFLRAAFCYALPGTTNLADFVYALDTVTPFKQSTSTTAGSWFTKSTTIPISTDVLAFAVVWDNRLSADPLSPAAQAGLWGRSEVFLQFTDPRLPPTSLITQDLRAFNIGIPEPAAPALFGLVAFIAWWRATLSKRKQCTSSAAIVTKSLLLLFTLGTLPSASAQGTVTFANASTHVWYVGADRNAHWDSSATNYSPSLQPGDLVSSNYAGLDLSFLRAAFCYAPLGTTNLADFVYAPDSVTTFKRSTSTTAGSWFAKTITLPISPRVLAFAVVWDVRLSADPLSPAAQNGLWGKSDIVLQVTSPYGPVAELITQDLRAFNIGIPEPAAPALFALAAVIAWWRSALTKRKLRTSTAAIVTRSLLLLLTLGTLTSAFAQGTVRFSNLTTDLPFPPDRLVRFDPVTVGTSAPNPFGTNGAPVVGTNYLAQLFYGPLSASAADLVAVSSEPARFRSTTTANPGTWIGGARDLEGFTTFDTVKLQVRVWDGTYASSWDEYLSERLGLAGESLMFTYYLRNTTEPNSENMFNFQGFYIGVPEPSSLVLIILGFCALTIRRAKLKGQ